jgi:hypothetical protein
MLHWILLWQSIKEDDIAIACSTLQRNQNVDSFSQKILMEENTWETHVQVGE